MRIPPLIVLVALVGFAIGGTARAEGPASDNSTIPGTVSGAGAAEGQENVLPTPVPDVPKVKPGVYPYNQPPSPPSPTTSAPAATGKFSPPVNQGPVTGYGAGGMGTVPGSPANPPYSFGGTGRPR